ncbi:MAG: hypothetical protein HC767_01760 [Akkermansiaceae bacterium]|nr:hypothetical protein [Akkermansiaceae bacterium]
MPDGTVFDSSLSPVGTYNLASIKPHRTVVGANGTPLGFLQPDGRVISPQDGANTGFFTPSGAIISEAGRFVGVVRIPSMDGLSPDADGIVRDADGIAVGRVGGDGTLVMGDPFAIREVRSSLATAGGNACGSGGWWVAAAGGCTTPAHPLHFQRLSFSTRELRSIHCQHRPLR